MLKEDLLKNIYKLQIRNSKKRGHAPPKYSYGEFRDWALVDDKFNLLYSEWADSNYKSELKPSCDRFFDDVGYSFDNIQWVTYKENISKPKGLQQKTIILLGDSNSVAAVVYGINNAAKILGVSHTKISEADSENKKIKNYKVIIQGE